MNRGGDPTKIDVELAKRLSKIEEQYGKIIVANKQMASGFVQLPRFILLNKGLSSNAKICYAGLLHFAWQEGKCFPGIDQFGETISLTKPTIIKCFKELETKKFIKIKRWGQGKNNTYYLENVT